MRVALAQINSVTGDLEGNAERRVGAIRRAREHGCDLVVAPEMALTGYACADLLEMDALVRENKALLVQKVAPEVHGTAALVGFVSGPCPAGVVPARSWRSGRPASGSWSELALGVGLGVPSVVVFWCASGPPALPAWPSGSWAPAGSGPLWSGAWRWVPAPCLPGLGGGS